MYVHRRVLEEVRNWLPSQKLTLAINDKKSCRLGPRDEPILRRATNVELDLSELPGHISHSTINLLCSLWREECNLKKISFSVLDESQEKLPNSLPAAKKKLLCECILRPIELVLASAKHKVEQTRTLLTWKQTKRPDWYHSRPELEFRYDHDRAVDTLLPTSAGSTASDLDRVWMPLVSAVRQGHRVVVDVLCNAVTVDLTKPITSRGNTLLMEAALHGDVQIMDRLLQGRSRGEIKDLLNLHDSSEKTAFDIAVLRLDLEMVSYLLRKHADPNEKGFDNCGALSYLILEAKKYTTTLTQMTELLCENIRLDKMARSPDGSTILHETAEHQPKLFPLIFRYSDIDINDVDRDNQTPLFYAVRSEKITAEGLIDKMINLYAASSDTKDRDGRTPLSYAVLRKSHKEIDLLLKAGADCTLQDESGRSPMFYAVRFDCVEATELLVKHLKDGNGALVLAVQMEKRNIQKALLEMCQDHTNFEEDNIRWLLLRAARDGQSTIVWEILHFHEIEADVRDENGRTPLSHAAEFDRRQVIEFLMERKADRDLKDDRGQSPVDYATKCGKGALGYLSGDWSSRLKEPQGRPSGFPETRRWPWLHRSVARVSGRR